MIIFNLLVVTKLIKHRWVLGVEIHDRNYRIFIDGASFWRFLKYHEKFIIDQQISYSDALSVTTRKLGIIQSVGISTGHI